MKKTIIVLAILLVLASLASPIVQGSYGPAPGRATYTDTETCKLCHINYLYVHHTTEIDCTDCHSFPSFILDCTECHPGFDHHEDTAGRCSDCHENKQKGRQR